MTPQQAAHRRERHHQAMDMFRHARQRPRVLRAAGLKIERMSSDRLRAVAGQRQRWQTLAWGYRDMIGELRAALKFRAQAISRVRFYVAEIVDDDDEPIALELRHEKNDDGTPTERSLKITLPEDLCQAAEAELARLPLDEGDSFLGVWSENFDVAGECWLYGRLHPDTGEETWEIRSIDDVEVQGSNVTIKDELGQPRVVDLEPDSNEELYRLWRKHPRRPYLADSALNACLDALEDITLAGREMRAVSRSRIASNGVAFIPDGMAELRNQREDDDREPADAFIADFTASIIAPISNEGDAGGIAPIVVIGSREDIAAVRFERLDREDSPTLIAKLDKGLARMGQSIDVPPEIITGLSGVNHWTAWQIDTATFRYYLEPGIREMADALTQCFIRRALSTFPPNLVKRVRIWFDAGAITENPNRRQDTLDAGDRMLISPRTSRKELGFGEGDAPTAEEVIAMIAAKQGFDAATAARVMIEMARQDGADLPEGIEAPAQIPQQAAPRQIAPAAPDATGTGGTGTPSTEPPGLNAAGLREWPSHAELFDKLHKQAYPEAGFVAAAAKQESTKNSPLWNLEHVLGHQLADIERGLRDQILLAADAAMTRAMERAGNRLRSKVQHKPVVASLNLGRQPTKTWALHIGKEQCFALGADIRFLLKEAFVELGAKFREWVNRAIDAMVARVLAFLKISPDSTQGRATGDRMRGAMAGRIDSTWSRLHGQLEQHAERVMFGEDGEPAVDGEQTDLTIPTDIVRQALALIGGLPETAAGMDAKGRIPTGEARTGLADGETVTGELDSHGVVPFGRTWQYNPTLERNTFEPHFDLDGTRFTSWTDPVLAAPVEYAWIGEYFRPKDHDGCLCTSAVTYAVPDRDARDALPLNETGAWSPGEDRDWEKALADQLRERLAQPSQDMAYLIELAESDDRAGRRFTVAQQQRDQWLEVQRLKNKFLNGE
jgi:hypothetical protein